MSPRRVMSGCSASWPSEETRRSTSPSLRLNPKRRMRRLPLTSPPPPPAPPLPGPRVAPRAGGAALAGGQRCRRGGGGVTGGDKGGVDATAGERLDLTGGVAHQQHVVTVAARREVQGDRPTVHPADLHLPEQVRKLGRQPLVAAQRFVGAVAADADAHATAAGGGDPAEPAGRQAAPDEHVDEVLAGGG